MHDVILVVTHVTHYVTCMSPCLVAGTPDAAVAAEMSPMEGKRQNYIHELINTEQTYIQALSVIYDVSLITPHCRRTSI